MKTMNSKNSVITTTNTSKPLRGYSRFCHVNDARSYLLDRLPSKYPHVIADHATHEFNITSDRWREDWRVYSSAPSKAMFYGYVNSGDGLECYLVEVDGKSRRPDGKLYHITWSLRPERYKPVDSNRLIVEKKYQPISPVYSAMNYWWEPFKH